MWWAIGCGLFAAAVAFVWLSVYAYAQMVINTKGDDIIENRPKLPPIWDSVRAEMAENRALAYRLPHEEIRIKSRDGLTLYGLYIPAEKQSDYTVIAVHGYMSTGLNEFSLYIPLYRGLNVNLLIVDLRAHGKSDGKVITFGYYDSLDCIDWCNYISSRFKNQHIVLHGISMGGATVDMTAGACPKNVIGVISDCAFANAYDIFRYVIRRDKKIPEVPFLAMMNVINMLVCGFNYKNCAAEERIQFANVPFLFIHGDKDRFVPVDMVRRLSEACPTEHKTVIIHDASHCASFLRDRDCVSNEIAGFIYKLKKRQESLDIDA